MSQYRSGPVQLETDAVRCDLRSDTVTCPDAGMRAAMAAAEVGDDVYGEDPTVTRLETALAERLGKEAGLFVASGTQSNLIAMLAHCARGEEVITGRDYHVFKYEAAGASVLGGCALYPLEVMEDGGLRAQDVRGAVKDDDSHHPVSRLLALENTHNGKAIPVAGCHATAELGREFGLATHLDGARFFNACVALKCAAEDLAAPFDTVSICLSKGLGAPVGSVLVGAQDLIDRARRLRKMLGGGMRQAGVLAAAGRYALDHNVARLAEDHERAEALAQVVQKAGIGRVDAGTNMVFVDPEGTARAAFLEALSKAGARINAGSSGPIRLVLHKDVSDQGLAGVIEEVRNL